MFQQVPWGRLVGREAELARLLTLLDDAASGQAVVALIGGDAGVGKTRLMAEVIRLAAEQHFTVLSGHCAELGESVPYLPLADALRGAGQNNDAWASQPGVRRGTVLTRSRALARNRGLGSHRGLRGYRRRCCTTPSPPARCSAACCRRAGRPLRPPATGPGWPASRCSARSWGCWPSWPPPPRCCWCWRTCTGRTRQPATCSRSCPGCCAPSGSRSPAPTAPTICTAAIRSARSWPNCSACRP